MSDHKSKSDKKRFLGIAIGVVALLAVAVGFGALARLLQNTIEKQAGEQKTVAFQAQDLRAQGKYEDASKKISDQLSKSSTSEDEKYALYIQQGSLFEDQQKLKEATESYIKALAIKESRDIYTILGDVYGRMGDKQKAIEAYKKAITLIKPADPVAAEDKASLEQRITSLGGQP